MYKINFRLILSLCFVYNNKAYNIMFTQGGQLKNVIVVMDDS